MTGKYWRFWTNSAIFPPPIISPVMIKHAVIFPSKVMRAIWVGCALFSKFLRLNAVLVELDELSSGVPSFLKSDHGKLLRIAILCLVTWVSRGTCVMVS